MRKDRIGIVTLPNIVTVGRVVGCIYLCFQKPSEDLHRISAFSAFIILFWLCDSLDGYLARKLKQATPFGAVLDLAGDRILDIFVALILISSSIHPFLTGVFLLIRFGFEPIVATFESNEFANGDSCLLSARVRRYLTEYSSFVKAVSFSTWLFFPNNLSNFSELIVNFSFCSVVAGYAIWVAVAIRAYLTDSLRPVRTS